ISTNIKLRRRELAMLRSVGMAEGEFHRMLRFECLFYGGRTLLFGLPLATLFAWLIQRGLASSEQLEHFPFLFPWASLLLSAVGVFALVFLTTWYAARQLKQENILDALRDEMT
ncbi:ABC transporter permease, partial [Evtepia gabavorous]